MKRLLALLLLVPSIAWGQTGISQIIVGGTPVKGGSDGDCLTIASGRLGSSSSCGGGGGDITIGTTNVTGGVSGRILYDNGGKAGELPVGTGVATALGINTGSAGALAVITGTLTSGNVPTLTTTGIQDSGVQLLTTMAANSVWGNNSSSAGAPGELSKILFPNGSNSAPVYSFINSTTSGMYSSSANVVDFASSGQRILQLSNGSASGYVQILYSGGPLIRAQGTNADLTLAANGTGEVYLRTNGATSYSGIARYTRSVAGGTGANIFRFTAVAAGANPVLSPLQENSGDTNVGLDLTMAGTGLVRNTGSYFVSRATLSIAGGNSAQALICGSSSNVCIYYGAGAPTFAATVNSLYLRSDGSSGTTRLYVNTDGATTWANFTSSS